VKRRWLTDRGLWVDSGEATLPLMAAIKASGCEEVCGLIPGDRSLLVVIREGFAPSDRLLDLLEHPISFLDNLTHSGRSHEIMVRYGGEHGPDLTEVAETAGMTTAQVIELHASVDYRVAFLGFQPGFAYMKGTPESLQMLRKQVPRTLVPAGSIALGGEYTGIYPTTGPGGWQIIGQTNGWLFDFKRNPPTRFAPGDKVRFVPT
jgi:KipI family sensor histidine kinase inhibitor